MRKDEINNSRLGLIPFVDKIPHFQRFWALQDFTAFVSA